MIQKGKRFGLSQAFIKKNMINIMILCTFNLMDGPVSVALIKLLMKIKNCILFR
jgi:hypothetical protein